MEKQSAFELFRTCTEKMTRSLSLFIIFGLLCQETMFHAKFSQASNEDLESPEYLLSSVLRRYRVLDDRSKALSGHYFVQTSEFNA